MKEKVKITGVPETMIQTLYARAKETQKNNAKIKDDIAVGIVEKLDYDFSKADNDKTMASGVIARTIVLDKMVGEYLDTHSDTVVVNIGCGMDTRCFRMQGKYKHWYNIDLPETINFLAYKYEMTQALSTWLVGHFSLVLKGRYEIVYMVVPLIILAFVFANHFNIVGMGKDFSKNLGVPYDIVLFGGLTIAAMITASVVVVVGSIN